MEGLELSKNEKGGSPEMRAELIKGRRKKALERRKLRGGFYKASNQRGNRREGRKRNWGSPGGEFYGTGWGIPKISEGGGGGGIRTRKGW